MTILCFADTRFPIERANGLQTMATCCALSRRGHHVTLVVRPDTAAVPRDPFAFYGEPPAPNVRVTSVPASGGRTGRVRFLLTALALARADGTAVVYTRDLGVAAFLLQVPLARRPRIVYEAHGVSAVVAEEMPALLGNAALAPSARKLRRLERRERRVWRRAAACVTVTRALAAELDTRHGPRSSVFVVPDGARPDRPLEAVPAGAPPTVGYAGHLYPWKGVDVFVRALALAPALSGLIVGGHPQETDRIRIEHLARGLGVRSRIEFTGLVPPREVRAALVRASVLVLPNTASAISARYTSPLKLFEYLTTGRPIVASDLPAIREVLADGQTAILAPAGDAPALAAALTRVAVDAALAARLGAASHALSASYSWDARAARLEPALDAAARA